MSNIEKFAEVVASKVSAKLSIEDIDKQEVLAYGTFVLIQTLISIIMVAIFGIIFNVFIETIIISFAASILRKFSGGAHATSPMNCALISMFIFGGQALLVKHYVMNIDVLYLVMGVTLAFIFTFHIMYKYSPVGTVTKQLRNENTRKRLKRKSIKFVLLLFVINIFVITMYLKTERIHLLTIAICISVGVVWQSITMVSLGHKIIDRLDDVLRGTSSLIRRGNL